MKKSIYTILVLIIVSFSCQIEKPYDVSIKEQERLERERAFFNREPSDRYGMNGRFDQNIYHFDSELVRFKAEDWKSIKNWQEVDEKLREQIEEYKMQDDYMMGIQNLSLKFLDLKLAELEPSHEKTEAVQYYLSVLLELNNTNWPVQTKSLQSIMQDLNSVDYANFKERISSTAVQFLLDNESKIEVLKKKYYSKDGMRNSESVEGADKDLLRATQKAEACLANLD